MVPYEVNKFGSNLKDFSFSIEQSFLKLEWVPHDFLIQYFSKIKVLQKVYLESFTDNKNLSNLNVEFNKIVVYDTLPEINFKIDTLILTKRVNLSNLKIFPNKIHLKENALLMYAKALKLGVKVKFCY